MSIPKIEKQYIMQALDYIDKNGVPERNQSKGYSLIMEDGKKYPPKYVIAVARHLATGEEMSTEGYNSIEAKNLLKKEGFTIDVKQEEYELTISSDDVISTDEQFSLNNLNLGDNYKPLEVYFINAVGDKIIRKRQKSENRISNQTLLRLACQIYEHQLAELSTWDKEQFPVCQYTPDGEIIRGIYPTVEEFKKHRNTIEYSIYKRENGPQFVVYSWNVFSTILFAKECLKRFGNSGDKFVLVYREKDETDEKEKNKLESGVGGKKVSMGVRNPYSNKLLQAKNVIFRGAPGTGKSYLAKEIAADIISDGYEDKYENLSEEQKKQVEFVQFHPSYDYTDFVEGLRPKMNDDGTMGFELQDGVFKKFIERARKNYENSQKSQEIIGQEVSAKEAISEFFNEVNYGVDEFHTITGNKFYIENVDENRIYISIPGNETVNKLSISMDEVRKIVASGEDFEKVTDIQIFLGTSYGRQQYSYELAICKEIKERKKKKVTTVVRAEQLKKYIFIIDEINRGEISKILGELFFAIDPGYRGEKGAVSTQYANMHSDIDEKFYIPENVYIIGTMNDIDRSVDSFDFAMRRRFRFIEIKADDRLEMLNDLEDEELKEQAIKKMTAINKEILKVEDLNENYQIGAAYFLKLKTLSFEELWTDSLKPLLQDYVRGMYNEEGIMERFAHAYGYVEAVEGDLDETTEN